MKSKYITIVIIGIITIVACYSASKITSDAHELTSSQTEEPTNSLKESPFKESTADTGTSTPYKDSSTDSASTDTDKDITKNVEKVEDKDNTTHSSSTPNSTTAITKKSVKSTEKASATSETKKSSNKTNNKATNKETSTPTKKASSSTKAPSVASGPIKIPTIHSVSASGKETYVSDNGLSTIDASNITKGYVAVKYTGSNHKVKVQIKLSTNVYNYDLASDSEYDYFPLQLGNGSYTINVLENISGTQYRIIQSVNLNVKLDNNNDVFLYPNQYVWFTQSSNVVTKSAQVCNGQTTTLKKIAAIFNYVTSNIKYDYNKAKTVQSGYLPDVDEILESGSGICFDYAAVFAAMCRAQGIPTKLITGYVSPNGVYHAWNEVYTPDKGWITVSFYLKTAGFNLVDPTFYSNMNDNKEAAEYIGNGSNYKTYHIY